VLPGWHTRGVLPRRFERPSDYTGKAREFSIEIHPAALPPDLAEVERPYRLRAGQAALHHVMMPHRSSPNAQPAGGGRWRRVVVLRFASCAPGTRFGPARYADYRSGETFAREYLVIAGSSGAERGMRRCGRTGPEGQGGGFTGDPDWDDSEGGRDEGVRQGFAQARM